MLNSWLITHYLWYLERHIKDGIPSAKYKEQYISPWVMLYTLFWADLCVIGLGLESTELRSMCDAVHSVPLGVHAGLN